MYKVPDTKVETAISFLFPNLCNNTKAYQAISEFINKEFDELQATVLYYRNSSFVDLISSFGLDVGTKEVIITPKYVLATEHYHFKPHDICYQY